MTDPHSHPGASDAELIQRTASGERRAFDELVRRHQASVYRFVRAITRTPEDAEDALQLTFLSAFRAAPGFRGDAAVRTWLFTIARNTAIRASARAARTESREAPDDNLAQLGVDAGWAQETPQSLAIRAENTELLRAALDSLAAEDREIIILRDLEGVSGNDAADLLGISLAAMKSRLHRARLRLAGALRKGDDHVS